MKKQEQKMKTIAVWMDPELYKDWKIKAIQTYGTANFSLFVREAIESFLKKEKTKV